MKFNAALAKKIEDDLKARKERAEFYNIENDPDVASLEKELEFFKCGSQSTVPQEWIERYTDQN
ncbi:hypothetical protein [Listeria booriae]|uniref:Phosphonoacetaldehyde reductase n=1 Tax=Listeria booriae TaxID=1552123 RepID=A0A842FC89_9LIST|nr:hypothetical protein [Listeria booriae]MBC2242259.1 phosphonoacetaldehyde reductase [Listeria booriae]